MSDMNKQRNGAEGEKTPSSKWKYKDENDPLLNTEESDHQANKGQEYKRKKKGFWQDALDTLNLALPIFISQLSWVGVSLI